MRSGFRNRYKERNRVDVHDWRTEQARHRPCEISLSVGQISLSVSNAFDPDLTLAHQLIVLFCNDMILIAELQHCCSSAVLHPGRSN